MRHLPRIPGREVIKHPDYTTLVASWPTPGGGLTVEAGPMESGGKTIYRMSFGDPSNPTVYINGGIHGSHEWHAPVSIPRWFDSLRNPSGPAAPLLAELARSLHWVSVPCINPHGYSQPWTLNRAGVNLNRNYPVGWDAVDESTMTGSKGTEPFSEIENQFVRDTVLAHKPVAFLDWHTWGGFTDGIIVVPEATSLMPWWEDAEGTFRLSTGRRYQMSSPGTDGTSGRWAATLTSSIGLPTLAATPETGSLNSSQVCDEYIQNLHLAVGVKVLDYVRTGSLVTRPQGRAGQGFNWLMGPG